MIQGYEKSAVFKGDAIKTEFLAFRAAEPGKCYYRCGEKSLSGYTYDCTGDPKYTPEAYKAAEALRPKNTMSINQAFSGLAGLFGGAT